MRFVVLGSAVLIFFTASVAAQQYPSKPVRMIIPAGPGGGVDTIARLVGHSLSSGSGTHLAFELFASMANVNIVHVPYKSGSSAIVDLAGGHVQLMFSNVINSMPHVKSRRLHALAITSTKRSALAPQLATVSESGLPGYQADAWYGVLVPARTPTDIVNRLTVKS